MCGKIRYFTTSDVKYLGYVFTLIYLLFGIAFANGGLLYYTELKAYEDAIGPEYLHKPLALSIVGFFMMIFTVFGAVAIRRNASMFVLCYSILSLLTGVLILIISVLGYLDNKDLYKQAEPPILKRMQNYFKANNDHRALYAMQRNLDCCGIDTPLDYAKKAANGTKLFDFSDILDEDLNLDYDTKLPDSCCVTDVENSCYLSKMENWDIGCYSKLALYIDRHNNTLSLMGMIFYSTILLGSYTLYAVSQVVIETRL